MSSSKNLLTRLAWLPLCTLAYASCDLDSEPLPLHIPTLPQHGDTPQAFVPKGWRIHQKLQVDLNEDGKADLALVIQENNPANRPPDSCKKEANYFDANPMAVLVALASEQGFTLLADDFNLLPRHDAPNMDQPFDGMTIKNRSLHLGYHIFFSSGSWEASGSRFQFRYQDGCMRLIGKEDSMLFRNSGELTETSSNYLSGKVLTRESKVQGGKVKSSWSSLKEKSMQCLGSLDKYQ